MADMDSRI